MNQGVKMLLDEIQEAKEKYLSGVKPKYIELYGELEPDLLFIDKSLIDDEIKKLINVEIILVSEVDHIAWHKKKHLDDQINYGQDGSKDFFLGFSEDGESQRDWRNYLFSDVFCDFEIKAYIEQSK